MTSRIDHATLSDASPSLANSNSPDWLRISGAEHSGLAPAIAANHQLCNYAIIMRIPKEAVLFNTLASR